MTTAPKTKELLLDSTDLKWLSEKIGHLNQGSFTTQSAVVASDYLNHTFKFKRRDVTDGYDGDLVLALRVVPA